LSRFNPPRIAFYGVVALIFVYALFPFYWAIRSAFTPDSEQFATPVKYIPPSPTLTNFREVLTNGDFQRALINSTIVAGSVTLIALLLGAFAGYALGRFRFRGRTATLYLMLSMTIFPQIAILGALYNLITRFHLFNTLGALVFSYMIFVLPFTVWVLTSFNRGLPRDLLQYYRTLQARHISIEEGGMHSRAVRCLTPADRAALGRGMVARRTRKHRFA